MLNVKATKTLHKPLLKGKGTQNPSYSTTEGERGQYIYSPTEGTKVVKTDHLPLDPLYMDNPPTPGMSYHPTVAFIKRRHDLKEDLFVDLFVKCHT